MVLPEGLLDKSDDYRRAFFHDKRIEHNKAKQIIEDIMRLIENPGPIKLLYLEGPTGVGKTTLLNHVVQKIIDISKDEMEHDKGLIPVLYVKVPLSAKGKMSWKELFKAILIEANEPLIDKKVPLLPGERTDVEYVLKMSVISCLKHRKVKVLVLDEGQHIAKLPTKGSALLEQLDSLKCLADETPTLFLLAGTYELSSFFIPNGQLSRRSGVIHFQRYLADNESDIIHFLEIVLYFQQRIPLKNEPPLVDYLELLYERSLGCIGLLKEWLERVLDEALVLEKVYEKNNKSFVVDKTLLKKCSLEPARCLAIANEAIEGEAFVLQLEDGEDELKGLLKIPDKFKFEENSKAEEPCEDKPKSRGKTRPGVRAPGRDPVGV